VVLFVGQIDFVDVLFEDGVSEEERVVTVLLVVLLHEFSEHVLVLLVFEDSGIRYGQAEQGNENEGFHGT